MKTLHLMLLLVLMGLSIGCSCPPPKFHPADKVEIIDGKYKYCTGVVIGYRGLHPQTLVGISCDLFLFHTRDYVWDKYMTKETK